MKSCNERHGKNLISLKILIRIFIAQVIMMLVLINMMLNVEHRKDFRKVKGVLMN